MDENTDKSLLRRLAQPENQPDWQEAWSKFVGIYTPLLFSWMRRRGLVDETAADVVQDVFMGLIETMKNFRYDEKKRFRNWLYTVSINKLRRVKRGEKNMNSLPDEPIEDPTATDPADEFLENNFRSHVLRQTLLLIKSGCEQNSWIGYWDHYVLGNSIEQIARDQHKEPSAVIAANMRIRRRIKAEVEGMLDLDPPS